VARRPCATATRTSPFQPLHEDAQTRAVPKQHLAPAATPVAEQEHVAGERIAPEPGLHESVEAIVAASEIDGRRVREHAYRSRSTDDHPRSRSRAAASVTPSPSTRNQEGEITVNVSAGVGSDTT